MGHDKCERAARLVGLGSHAVQACSISARIVRERGCVHGGARRARGRRSTWAATRASVLLWMECTPAKFRVTEETTNSCPTFIHSFRFIQYVQTVCRCCPSVQYACVRPNHAVRSRRGGSPRPLSRLSCMSLRESPAAVCIRLRRL